MTATLDTNLAADAATLRSLHDPGDPLVLVNVWDAGSAHRVADAGAKALATSSLAIATAIGIPDSPDAPLDEMFGAIRRITAATDLPVSADLFDGYGLPADELVERLLGAGAVGFNIEDSDHRQPGTLVPASVAAARVADLRRAADRAGIAVVINARTDVYLYDGGDGTTEVISRARAYLDAGADCVYPVRLNDAALARRVVDELGGAPVNANADVTTIDDIRSSGASRISIGPQAFFRAYSALDTIAAALLRP
jgi:2-methylisocitrate lyase-like PEP mutase family enzyme